MTTYSISRSCRRGRITKLREHEGDIKFNLSKRRWVPNPRG